MRAPTTRILSHNQQPVSCLCQILHRTRRDLPRPVARRNGTSGTGPILTLPCWSQQKTQDRTACPQLAGPKPLADQGPTRRSADVRGDELFQQEAKYVYRTAYNNSSACVASCPHRGPDPACAGMDSQQAREGGRRAKRCEARKEKVSPAGIARTQNESSPFTCRNMGTSVIYWLACWPQGRVGPYTTRDTSRLC